MIKSKFFLIIVFILLTLLILFFNFDIDKNDKSHKTVAFISLSNVDNDTFKGFKTKMEDYGWDENKNIKYIVPGAAKKVSNLKSITMSVIAKKPDLILVSSTPATQEVKRLTKDKKIPVVFCPVNDPVGSGIVLSLNRPETLITGIRLPIGDAKRFEWLYEIMPSVKNVLVPMSKDDGSSKVTMNNIKNVAKYLKINIIKQELDENINIDNFFAKVPKSIDAIYLPRDSRVEAKIEEFVKFSIKEKLPLSAPSYQQVNKGALFTYGFIHTELGVDAARMVDKILRGAEPADLPVKIGNAHLVLNEKTAKDIGIKFSKKAIRNAKYIIK